MCEFKIGDEVSYKGIRVGVVKDLRYVEDEAYGVAFYNWHSGHNLNGTIDAENGWYCQSHSLTLIISDLENV